jgi:8-oxo-dGTP diphosphatase
VTNRRRPAEDDHLPALRGTALINAPARTVAAVVAEPWLLRESLAPLRVRVRSPKKAQWCVGDELSVDVFPSRLPVRFSVGLRVTSADADGLVLTGGGGLPKVRLTATVARTGDGTVLTYGIGWVAPGGWLGRLLDFAVGRRLVLRMLPALLTGARQRAEQLADAPVVVGAVIQQDATVLAAQRDRPPASAGRWEFPGGRVEPGEDECAAVVRECREELGAAVVVSDRFGPDLVLANGWLLRLYLARLAPDARPTATEHRAIRWVSAAQLAELDWLDADRIVLPTLAATLAVKNQRAATRIGGGPRRPR